MLGKLKETAANLLTRSTSPSIITPKILLLGPTGSGKSSLLNLFCNFNTVVQQGVEGIEHFKAFNDLSMENATEHKMSSKTSGATLYEVDFVGTRLLMVDTPGFGDSRGMDVDKEHAQKIVRAVESVEHITMICLVVNGRDSRMGASLKYVLTAVTSILPRQVLENILVVFTNTADALDLNFDLDELKEYFGKPITHSICIENPYCRVEKAKAKQGKLSLALIAKSLKKSFEDTAEQLMSLLQLITTMTPVPTLRFLEIYQKKQWIERTVLDILAEYDHLRAIDKQIRKAEEEIQAAVRTRSLNSKFDTERTTQKWMTRSTPRHNTLCGFSGCYSNCHKPCNLDKAMSKEVFRKCAAMSGGSTCTVCGHAYQYHYHDEVVWESRTETINLVDDTMKAKFEQARTVEDRARILRDGLSHRRRESQENKKDLSARLLLAIDQYQKVGITRSYRQMINAQKDLLSQHLEAMEGELGMDEVRKGLAAALQDLERQLNIIDEAEKMPWDGQSPDLLHWAGQFMDLPARTLPRHVVKKRFDAMAKDLHPDKPGGNDAMFKKLLRARTILEDCATA